MTDEDTGPEQPGQITAPNDQQVALLKKLLAAALAIESIEKDGFNSFHSYAFASAEAYLFKCRRELLSRGILVLGGQSQIDERMRPTNQGESAITTVHLMYKVFDCDTGFSLEIPWSGRGEDPMDKGLSKALTNAVKTFLRQQLLLPMGDDPEADESTDHRAVMRGAPGASGAATVNLIAEAKGLSDQTLQSVLTAAGLPASDKPFGSFTRIPVAAEVVVREELNRAKTGALA